MKNGAALYVAWPTGDDVVPYFYVEHMEGMQPNAVATTKRYFGSFGVVPTLSPIESNESSLSPDHIRLNYSTRLASSHFRNQLNLMRSENRDDFAVACAYILENTPEVDSLELVVSENLDLFYREQGGRTERELCWAGDGLQIWLQVLFHIWRQRGCTTLILDEPDVFLHPDLQRRLVRVLDEMPCQVVLATHAPEILSEASREAVVIVDRTRNRSRRVTNEKVRSDLNELLGSGFNLKLARALRSKVALFVEGNDMKILKNIAKVVGAGFFAGERGLTIASMGGRSNHHMATAFGWLNDNLLDNAVNVRVVLDRDYSSDTACADLEAKVSEAGVNCHIWRRKELESYLLVPSLIARVSGASEDQISDLLAGAVHSLRAAVLARFLDDRQRTERSGDRHAVTVHEEYLNEFEQNWSRPEWAQNSCPAKDLLSSISGELQQRGFKAVSARQLSARIRAHEVPAEMRDVILEVESLLTSPSR